MGEKSLPPLHPQCPHLDHLQYGPLFLLPSSVLVLVLLSFSFFAFLSFLFFSFFSCVPSSLTSPLRYVGSSSFSLSLVSTPQATSAVQMRKNLFFLKTVFFSLDML